MITPKGANINIVGNKTIQWSMETDTVLITPIGKSAEEIIWLVNRIDVNEGGFSANADIKIGAGILEVTDALCIPEILISKIS